MFRTPARLAQRSRQLRDRSLRTSSCRQRRSCAIEFGAELAAASRTEERIEGEKVIGDELASSGVVEEIEHERRIGNADCKAWVKDERCLEESAHAVRVDVEDDLAAVLRIVALDRERTSGFGAGLDLRRRSQRRISAQTLRYRRRVV